MRLPQLFQRLPLSSCLLGGSPPCAYNAHSCPPADLVPLSAQDLASISALHTQPGKHRSLCDYGPGLAVPGKVWGWRVKEDLGWEYDVPSKGENNASFRL